MSRAVEPSSQGSTQARAATIVGWKNSSHPHPYSVPGVWPLTVTASRPLPFTTPRLANTETVKDESISSPSTCPGRATVPADCWKASLGEVTANTQTWSSLGLLHPLWQTAKQAAIGVYPVPFFFLLAFSYRCALLGTKSNLEQKDKIRGLTFPDFEMLWLDIIIKVAGVSMNNVTLTDIAKGKPRSNVKSLKNLL